MMLKLLEVNISQFDEEADFSQYINDGVLDVDKLVDDYKEPEVEEEPEAEEQESSEEEEEKPEVEESEAEAEEEPEKRTPDQAFAEMRRKIEAQEPLANWVQELATDQGFKDAQELIDAYKEQKLAKDAQEEGVPVDVYRRLHELEEKTKTQAETAIEQQFNHEVETVKDKYSLSQEQLTSMFEFMAQRGFKAGSIPFEDVYVLANRETLIQDAEERGKNSYLKEKQKQQQEATPDSGTHASDQSEADDLDYSKEAIFKTLGEYGIEVD